jgi:hypothetical protein
MVIERVKVETAGSKVMTCGIKIESGSEEEEEEECFSALHCPDQPSTVLRFLPYGFPEGAFLKNLE